MAFAEQRAAFFPDFGITAVVDGVSCSAIFDAPADDVLGLTGTKPSLLVASADITSAAIGDAVTANSASYTIAELQPDGTGMTRVILEAV